MELILKNENPKIQRILEELKKELVFPDTNQSLVISTVQDKEKGFLIELQKEVITIHYHKHYDLARAILNVFDNGVTAQYEKDPTMEYTQDLFAISETCAFEDFGMMVDCSRNAVPSVQTLKKQVRLLALMGYHYLGLYVEDTLKVKEEPYFGYKRGAYTTKEIKEVSDYAALFDMEVRPYIQTLAHFNQIKRYESYREFMDFDDILLVKDERTYLFLEHLIKSVAEGFSSKVLNIGMDEAHMIGLGKYLELHGYENRVEIMQKHLKRVLQICEKYGFKVQMWSDMFFKLMFGGEYDAKEEELKDKVKDLNLPKNLELVYWDYFSCEEEHYAKMLQKHKYFSKNIGFASGAWKWTGFTPHNGYSMQASEAALNACKKEKISSVVITAWGDNGAEASLFSILPALFYDAKLAYGNHMSDQVFEELTGIPFEEFLKIDLANPYAETKKKHNNASKYYLYNDPLLQTFDSAIMEEAFRYYENTAHMLKEFTERKPYGYLFATQQRLCEVLKKKAQLGTWIKEAYEAKKRRKLHSDLVESNANDKDKTGEHKFHLKEIYEMIIPEIINELEKFYETFLNQWMQENKAFGFEIQSIRLGGLQKRLEDIAKRLKDFDIGNIESIEELEEETLPFAYFLNDDKENLSYNLWSDIASPGVMG